MLEEKWGSSSPAAAGDGDTEFGNLGMDLEPWGAWGCPKRDTGFYAPPCDERLGLQRQPVSFNTPQWMF